MAPLVEDFYRENFWDQILGDEQYYQEVANTIYDFAVNTGTHRAVRIAQGLCGVTIDGVLGPKSLRAINGQRRNFVNRYTIAKIRRYAAICNKDRKQSKFLLGWINRTLKAK